MILEIKDLHKTYTQAGTTINVLSGLNLAVDAGETVAIVGQSGSGKSTLLSLMAGLDTPSSGSISVAKKNLGSLSEQELARYRALHLGIVFQQFHLISSLTAVENVSLPLQIAGDNEAGQKAHLALEKVGLSKRLTHFPSQLSGGEQQRVAIARAFVVSPSVMLADEPSGNLDAQTGTRIMDLIFSMSEAKETTLILVTHNEELAQRCSRTLCLKQGQLKDVR